MLNAKCSAFQWFILHCSFCNLHLFKRRTLNRRPPIASPPAKRPPSKPPSIVSPIQSFKSARSAASTSSVDTQVATGPTTGLVISPDGYIVSSAFNFVQQPASILVTLPSGKQSAGELVATDHSRMLVLLHVKDVSNLPVPEMTPADEIHVGDWAIAIGRTFRADRANVTVGIVSALDRMVGKAVQTDAAVSTANYGGPLIDIRGRVLGLIVPMAPQTTSEVAGVEWYDSGIGFAVPLAAMGPAIERLKKGEDQYPGLLGVSLNGRQPIGAPAVLAAVRPDSPAGKAGLKKGDRLTEIDGRAIKTQTDLRLALGSRYAGDSVRVTAKRGEEAIERTVTLIGKMPPFHHAFLGVLPMRPGAPINAASNLGRQPSAQQGVPPGDGDKDGQESADQDESDSKEKSDQQPSDTGDDGERSADESTSPQGVVVRMVYPGSPAAEARIQAGDRILKINGEKLATISDAIDQLNSVAPDDEVQVAYARGDDALEVKVKAARLPTNIPTELPPAIAHDESSDKGDGAKAAAGETRDLKLAAMPEKCKVYVPPSQSGPRPGLLIWLHAPGESKPDDVIAAWKPICDRDNLVLVVPTAEDVKQWERTELEYLSRLTERLLRQYRPDPRRVVVFGQGGGGSMAYLLGLAMRERFSGIAATAVALPRQVKVPDGDPALRLAIFAGLTSDAALAADISQGLQKLSEVGYPVSTIATADATGRLAEADRAELARWVDTLDRF